MRFFVFYGNGVRCDEYKPSGVFCFSVVFLGICYAGSRDRACHGEGDGGGRQHVC